MSIHSKIENINILDHCEPFEICIIGSGPTGTVLGRALVERGIRTLILESGGGLARWLLDSRLKGLAAYQFTGDTDYPLTETKARVIGGNSNFWTGRCERFHPSDFENNPYTPVENPWPFRYNNIEPYYEKAENILRVRGGSLSEFVPPRKNPLPLPPSPDISFLKDLLGKAGVTVDASPTATPSKGIRFFRVQKEILPGFLKSPHGVLVSGGTVTRLIPNSDWRIKEAEVRTLNQEPKVARARYFVVCCGGIETPRLLLLSRSEKFPDGIGNTFDRVGRGFNEHAGVNFYGKIHHKWGTIYPSFKIGRCHQFYDKFRSKGLGSVLPVVRQSWILPHHLVPFKLTNLHKNFLALASRIHRPTLYLGATIEMRVSDANRVTLGKNKKDAFGNELAHLYFNYSEEDLETLDRSRGIINYI